MGILEPDGRYHDCFGRFDSDTFNALDWWQLVRPVRTVSTKVCTMTLDEQKTLGLPSGSIFRVLYE